MICRMVRDRAYRHSAQRARVATARSAVGSRRCSCPASSACSLACPGPSYPHHTGIVGEGERARKGYEERDGGRHRAFHSSAPWWKSRKTPAIAVLSRSSRRLPSASAACGRILDRMAERRVARPNRRCVRHPFFAAQLVDDRAVAAVVAAALLDQINERVADRHGHTAAPVAPATAASAATAPRSTPR